MSVTLGEQLDRLDASAVGVRLPEGDWTFGDLRARVDALADGLAAGGVGGGSRVVIAATDTALLLVAVLATVRVGAIGVPINPALGGDDLAYVLGDVEPDAVLAEEQLLDGLDPGDGTGAFVAERDRVTERRACARPAPRRVPEPEHPATILYTSGSSGRPKGVVLSHRAHTTMGRAFATVLNTTPDDSYLLCAPLFHVSGWSTAVFPTLATGCSVVIPGRFSASSFWGWVDRWRPTLWPTGLSFLELVAAGGGEAPERNPFRHVLSNLRDDTWVLGTQQLHLPLGTYLGLTETNGRGAITPRIDRYETGLLGRPYVPTDGIRITVGNDELPPGEVGEIEMRNPSMMTGYFRNRDATDMALRPDGWLRTGDLGLMDEQGRLFYRGRIKNIIRRSGETISAEEVEQLLLGHPDVVDAIVIGVPDRIREEEVKAIVVRRPGADVTAADLHDHCAARVAAYKAPRYVELAAELPRTVSGKPDVGTARRTMSGVDSAWDRER